MFRYVPLFLFLPGLLHAQPAVPLPANTLETFSVSLKNMLVKNLPNPLYEKSDNWGHQDISPKLKGLRIVHVPRNDGTWKKIRATAPDVKALELTVHDLTQRGQDQVGFKVAVALPTLVEMEEEIWESGHRLYRGTVRARLRIKLALDVENTIKFDFKGGLLPDVIFRLKVKEAKVSYDNLVVEHIGHLGGTAARLTGEAVRSTLKQWKPSVERDLLARASAAILKAGDTKEIRLALSSLTK